MADTFSVNRERGSLIVKVVLLIIAITLASGVIYYFYGYTRHCETESCFLDNLAACRRASFISEQQGNKWLYETKGKAGNFCTVYVKNLEISSQEIELQSVKGKDMFCRIPKEAAGSYIEIQQQLEFCTGPLKEELQDVIIKKLYNYIIQNLGDIKDVLRRG